ncbi:glycoside hydrolase family 78 protein [Tellurirhabdus bombi]|uniref:glycoside hydrolase family 78 protein n=1 Tax=Tellurirhabdus bombi TaxID=2907205 RepID=UPI001F358E07|nr:glycoside hydrolase family 78 protein [Tellurirhabdus bombi]
MRFLLASLLTLTVLTAWAQKGILVTNLRCENQANPLGIDVAQPRLGWQISSSARKSPIREIEQQSYQILVASTPEKLAANEGDLWDSGVVKSEQSVFIPYGGKPLESRRACYWKVNVKTMKDTEVWSEPASWTMGLLRPSDWSAKWTGLDSSFAWEKPKDVFTRVAARYFRKEADLPKKIRKATAYVSGLGVYELYLNSRKVGDAVLAPAPTDYNKRIFYNTYDVTNYLKQGRNALGMLLGNGRFYTLRWGYKELPEIAHYGFPKMRLQIEVTYEDGSTERLISDESWKVTAAGPIVANNEFDGEEYDATKELSGWETAGYNDSQWLKAQLVSVPSQVLESQPTPPIRVTETLKAQAIKEVKPDTFIVDLGQNLVGWARLHVRGPRGTKVTLRFAERVNEDGTLYLDNLRSAKVTDVYTLKGDGEEVWEPRFVYHGFRYVEITGFPGTPTVNSLEGRVVHDDLPIVGSFASSNSLLNQLYKNAFWGIRGNYRGMPTDCPQRDERMGWLGDRAIGSKGESFVFGHHDLYAKWLTDIEDAQLESGSIPDVAPAYWKMYSDNMTWPAAYIIIANMLYEQYGDDVPIRKHYPSMKKWLTHMRTKYMKDYIMTKDTYGDWCMPPESPELIHSQDPKRKTDGTFLGTAFYYNMLTIMEQFAEITGNSADKREFAELAGHVKKAFNDKFLNRDRQFYSNNTATANLFALAYGLAPEELRSGVFEQLVERTTVEHKGHISTGLVGAQWLMRTLSDNGRPDLAYRIATNTDYPSWGYMIQNGATTIWELWNGNTANPAMNSGNHVMLLGDLIIWMYENLAGIKAEEPGFKRIIMKPTITGDLTSVTSSFESFHGRIGSEWERKGGKFNWKVTVPGNTRATLYIPATDQKAVREGRSQASLAPGVRFVKMEGGNAVFEVTSGAYNFRVK